MTHISDIPLKAVKLALLDEDENEITFATGFITSESGNNYLYTAWHVVTGYDPHDLKFKLPPKGDKLAVFSQNVERKTTAVTAVGGTKKHVIELYDKTTTPKKPLWLQDRHDIPNQDLNAINIRVPSWHDAIKIKINIPELMSKHIAINEKSLPKRAPALEVGEKILIVGYPHGYSALGDEQTTPIVLTRFIAANQVSNRKVTCLIDGFGAPSMSGSPVFFFQNETIKLLGIYTGLIYPDFDKYNTIKKEQDKFSALGTFENMVLVFKDGWMD